MQSISIITCSLWLIRGQINEVPVHQIIQSLCQKNAKTFLFSNPIKTTTKKKLHWPPACLLLFYPTFFLLVESTQVLCLEAYFMGLRLDRLGIFDQDQSRCSQHCNNTVIPTCSPGLVWTSILSSLNKSPGLAWCRPDYNTTRWSNQGCVLCVRRCLWVELQAPVCLPAHTHTQRGSSRSI